MKNILFTLLFTFFASSPLYAFDPAVINAIIDNSNVIVDDGCSGTIINIEHALVLTNHHCIVNRINTKTKEEVDKDGNIVERKIQEIRDTSVAFLIYDENGIQAGVHTYRADILAQEKSVDLALLQVRGEFIGTKSASVLLPREEKVERLDTAIAVGNPLGMYSSSSVGKISFAHRELPPQAGMKKDMTFYQYDGGIVFGNSGGALYNESGNLIGVPFAFMGPFIHMGFIIPHTEIWAFLDKACWSDVLDADYTPPASCKAKIEKR